MRPIRTLDTWRRQRGELGCDLPVELGCWGVKPNAQAPQCQFQITISGSELLEALLLVVRARSPSIVVAPSSDCRSPP